MEYIFYFSKELHYEFFSSCVELEKITLSEVPQTHKENMVWPQL